MFVSVFFSMLCSCVYNFVNLGSLYDDGFQ